MAKRGKSCQERMVGVFVVRARLKVSVSVQQSHCLTERCRHCSHMPRPFLRGGLPGEEITAVAVGHGVEVESAFDGRRITKSFAISAQYAASRLWISKLETSSLDGARAAKSHSLD